MKTRLISILLALTLSVGTVATLASCDDQGKETDAPTSAPTETVTEPETEPETETDESDTAASTEKPAETSTEASTNAVTETTDTEETPSREEPTEAPTEPETETATEAPTDTPIEDIVYGNGGTVDGAGAVIKDGENEPTAVPFEAEVNLKLEWVVDSAAQGTVYTLTVKEDTVTKTLILEYGEESGGWEVRLEKLN